MQAIDNKIKSRVYGRGRGSVFTPNGFLDLGSRDAVDKALSRCVAKGSFRRLGRGLYDFPRQDREFGTLFPSIDAIANALKGRDAIRLQPSGAYAANLLGLTEQVPMRAVFLTDGNARRMQLDKRQIILKHTTPRNVATAGRTSGLVIQALRWLGKKHVDDQIIKKLRAVLTPQDKRQLIADIRYAPAWIADVMRQVAEGAGK